MFLVALGILSKMIKAIVQKWNKSLYNEMQTNVNPLNDETNV